MKGDDAPRRDANATGLWSISMLHYEHQSQTVDLMFDSENYQGKYEA
jgi:hypothetical protein